MNDHRPITIQGRGEYQPRCQYLKMTAILQIIISNKHEINIQIIARIDGNRES